MAGGTDGGRSSEGGSDRSVYAFERLDTERLPPNVQYTPEFDDDWIYPSGASDGGRRDDVPVQGLELGVVTHVNQLRATVEAVLDGLTAHYHRTGAYPRHRLVADQASFETVTDGEIGIAAVCQPRPDRYDGLTDHMQAMTDGEKAALTPNRETARLLAATLAEALAAHEGVNSSDGFAVNVHQQRQWERYRQIGHSAAIERYAPLGLESLYDPLADEVDFDEPGLDDVSELSASPAYLDIDDPETLRGILDGESEGDGDADDDGNGDDEGG